MTTLIILIIPVLLVAFWAWMFSDMLLNDAIRQYEPVSFHWPPTAKNHWTVFFIIFSLFTAGYYYFTVYHKN